MRVGSDLRTKALIALEEVLHEARYAQVQPSRAVGFALAYLWEQSRGDRTPFDKFWASLSGENQLHRFGYADQALTEIHQQLGVPRDEAVMREMWRRAQALAEARRKGIAGC